VPSSVSVRPFRPVSAMSEPALEIARNLCFCKFRCNTRFVIGGSETFVSTCATKTGE